MSVEFTITPVIGFRIDPERLGPRRKVTPQKVHLEPRWDPKTGKQLDDERVIDEEGSFEYELGGEIFDSFGEFGRALAKAVAGHFVEAGSYLSGETYGFVSILPTKEAGHLDYPVYVNGPTYLPANLQGVDVRLAGLRRALQGFGLEVSQPVLAAAMLVS